MRMTKTEWQYLQKVALDHPYYDTHKPPLTEAEAKAVVEANNAMTGREFVDSVYASLGMTRPSGAERRFDRLRGIADLLSVPTIRRIAIIILAVILATLFLTMTPAGRTVAEEIGQFVVRLFDKNAVMSGQDGENPIRFSDEVDQECDISLRASNPAIRMNSFEAFTKETGKIPVILPLKCEEIEFERYNGIGLHSTYTVSGKKVHLKQHWDISEEVITASTVSFRPHPLNESVLYSMDAGDGSFCCIVVLENSELIVLAEKGVDIDALVTMITQAI